MCRMQLLYWDLIVSYISEIHKVLSNYKVNNQYTIMQKVMFTSYGPPWNPPMDPTLRTPILYNSKQHYNSTNPSRPTSLAPYCFRSRTSGPIVVPLTIESSTSTTLRPSKLAVMAPNFFATASCLERVSGWMKLRPTYLFLHRTST